MAFADPVQEFASMLSELERVAGKSSLDLAMREVRINVVEADSETLVSIIDQACELLNREDETLSRATLQVEIQTWAASPTPTAWLDAISHASHLRQEVHARLSYAAPSDMLMLSSAALGPYADRLRPALTIVLRFKSSGLSY
jgi:hypothetical protein